MVGTGLITVHGGEHGWTWGPGYRHMGGASRPQCICQVMSLRASAITRYLYIYIFLVPKTRRRGFKYIGISYRSPAGESWRVLAL